MAYLDSHRGEVVVRILYDGLATAGKTSTLRALRAAFSCHADGEVFTPEETRTGRTAFFDWLDLRTGWIDELPLRCQVLSVPGQFALAHRRARLLTDVDAVVLVCDSTPKGLRAAAVALRSLVHVLHATKRYDTPLVVQANKQDLPNALTPDEIEDVLLGGGHADAFAGELPSTLLIVPTVASTGEGVRLPFLRALDAVRLRLRPQLQKRGVWSLPSNVESAEGLYEAMLHQDNNGDEDPKLVAALDAAAMSMVASGSPNSSDE